MERKAASREPTEKPGSMLAEPQMTRVSNPTKLIDYLVSLFPGVQFEVEKLQKHSSNMSQNKSFKLGCDYSMLDKIKKPETWPENIWSFSVFKWHKD